MEERENSRLTLDRPATYQIKVPVEIDRRWADWVEGMRVETTLDDSGRPITTLNGALDQAALQGLLRRLYSLGIPLISVNCSDETCDQGKR
jgi:hypothetical protein